MKFIKSQTFAFISYSPSRRLKNVIKDVFLHSRNYIYFPCEALMSRGMQNINSFFYYLSSLFFPTPFSADFNTGHELLIRVQGHLQSSVKFERRLPSLALMPMVRMGHRSIRVQGHSTRLIHRSWAKFRRIWKNWRALEAARRKFSQKGLLVLVWLFKSGHEIVLILDQFHRRRHQFFYQSSRVFTIFVETLKKVAYSCLDLDG